MPRWRAPRRLGAVAVAIVTLTLLPTMPALAPWGSTDPRSFGEAGSGPAAPYGPARAGAAQDASAWEDVPAGHWARAAVDHVALDRDWMRDQGDAAFHPDDLESRALFARALVRAFAPDEPLDPEITFTDLPPEDPFYPFANVAVKNRWITRIDGAFRPENPVKTAMVHRALVWALGLRDAARGLEAIHTSDSVAIQAPWNLGALNIGMLLYLRYNHRDESLDVAPQDRLSRAEVAWSLYRADLVRTSETWRLDAMAAFEAIELGPLSETKRAIIEFGLRSVGYPYVWGGDWNEASPDGYCCGDQPVGGFDCSGLMWWVLKEASGGYDNSAVRPYAGWALPERSSKDMSLALLQEERRAWTKARAGDLLFYDGDGDGTVDHVNLYLGRGWALDSSSGVAGVTVLRVGEGWYRDHFVWARRVTS